MRKREALHDGREDRPGCGHPRRSSCPAYAGQFAAVLQAARHLLRQSRTVLRGMFRQHSLVPGRQEFCVNGDPACQEKGEGVTQ